LRETEISGKIFGNDEQDRRGEAGPDFHHLGPQPGRRAQTEEAFFVSIARNPLKRLNSEKEIKKMKGLLFLFPFVTLLLFARNSRAG
jgi:hypothetical protein